MLVRICVYVVSLGNVIVMLLYIIYVCFFKEMSVIFYGYFGWFFFLCVDEKSLLMIIDG